MFTAPINRSPANGNGHTDETESKETEQGKSRPGPIISMLQNQLTRDNIEPLGFIEYVEIKQQFDLYLSGDWEAGYGGLPRCLRICLLVYSLLILKQRFGVQKWQPDADGMA